MDAVAYIINGKTVIIDRDWLPYVQSKRWCMSTIGAAYATHRRKGRKPELLHRTIIGASEGQSVDHVNSNSLDNRLVNLRICNQHQNTMNQLKRKNSASKFKGVTPCKRSNGKLWYTQIAPNGQNVFLGRFSCEETAARAYDEAAKTHYGEFAKLNFPVVPDNEIKISETFYQPDYRSLTSSKYRGVRFVHGKWSARVSCKDGEIYLKSHKTEEDAARAHDKKSWEIFRDPKKLNFPEEYLT